MGVLKTKKIDLVTNAIVSPAAWDSTKPYLSGNARSKLVNGQQSVGSALTKVVDVGNDFNLVPSGINYYDIATSRFFILTTFVTNQARVLLYNIDRQTLVATPVGQVAITYPATPTFKELIVDCSGTTNWKIKVLQTNTTVFFGGLYITQKVDLADFAMVGFPTFNFAFNETDAKKTYKYVTSTQPASLNTSTPGTENVGIVLGMWQSSNVIKVLNGASATARAMHFNNATLPAHTASTVTITIASPCVVSHASHGRVVGDPVTFQTTGALPTNLVVGAIYYIIAAGFTANSYQVSTTQGGVAVNTAGTQSGVHTAGLPHGEATTNHYLGSSGIITPAFTGTLLTTQNAQLKVKPDAPNIGENYIAINSNSNLYRIKESDLAISSSSFTSLETVNILSTTPSPLITAPTVAYAAWVDDPLINRWLYITNSLKIVEKPFLNNTIYRVFGSLFNRGTENQMLETLSFGGIATIGFMQSDGVLFLTQNTTNQRGVLLMDYKSDAAFDYSYILSPVVTINKAILCFINTVEALFESTGTVRFYYKTSGFSGAFSGFTEINTAEELSLTLGTQVQFAVKTDCATEDASTHAQLIALLISFLDVGAMSDYFAQSNDATVTTTPAKSAFIQKQNRGSAHPKLYFRAYSFNTLDLVAQANTVDNPTLFEYSTNDGLTYNNLGTIPDNKGTIVRYKWASPPGEKVIISINEE